MKTEKSNKKKSAKKNNSKTKTNKNIKKNNSKNIKQKNNMNNKIININSNVNVPNFVSNKKLKFTMIFIFIILIFLVIRIGWLQFADGPHLKELSFSQQSINQIISPKRGNIYDSTGKALAISAQVDTITINPKKIKDENKEKVAKGLSDIFELDFNETFQKVNSSANIENIAKKVEQNKVDKLKNWMKENKLYVGINIDEDTKRYYPYSNLASAVIGFCGSDNQGLSGIEYKWDSILTGTPGKIVSSKDSSQSEIPNSIKKYIEEENGSNLTLTLDINIQTIVEKYLKQAVEENSCQRGGNVIVMNPSNGDILAMACYPNYNLNEPFSPNESLSQSWDTLSDAEQKTELQKMWSNKSVSESYEPGSIYKIITASVAIEENITVTDKNGDFLCTGHENVNGTNIKCWSPTPHGYQTLRKALENSCNPAFMQLGKRIGASTLYKYYKAYGFFDKTNVDLPGETTSIYHDLSNVGPVELATMSFGQRFTITPLQMITAVSAVANDGVLVKPRIVKEITNSDNGAVTTVEPIKIRQVISKETAEKVTSMMQSVATTGTGRRAAVDGYSIGGKTGTSEPPVGNKEAGYVASYMAISPVENTEVALLLTLYKPTGSSHQGGTICGPVVSQMFSEILPYLGVSSDSQEKNTSTSTTSSVRTVQNVQNKTVTEAKKVLESDGFKVKINSHGDQNSLLVKEQVPKPGISLLSGSTIVLYSEENEVRTSVTVPDLKGMSAAQATNALQSKNLNITIDGSGTVVSQDQTANSSVEEGTVIKVTLKHITSDDH